MGFFDRIRHPVQGTATVTAATSPVGMRSPQEVRMTLTVTGLGVEPFTLEHEEKCHTDRWPKAGMQLPVVFDSERHERMEVQWDDVQPGEAAAAPPPQAGAAPVSGEPLPPEAQGLIDQFTKAFPDANVQTHTETRVIDLSNDPAAAANVIGSVEAATGMDLDGDGRIGGSAPPPGASVAAPSPSPAPSPRSAPSGETVSRLERLAALHARGALTDEEFAQQKARILGG